MWSLNLSYLIDFIERLKFSNRRKNVPVFICIIHWLIKRRELRAPKRFFNIFYAICVATQRNIYLNKLLSFAAAHSGWETDRWTFLTCNCCSCAGGGRECGCFVLLSVVVLKLSNEKSLCSDGWYDAAGLKYSRGSNFCDIFKKCRKLTFQLNFAETVTEDVDVAFETELVAADAGGRESNECLYGDYSRGCPIVLTSQSVDF